MNLNFHLDTHSLRSQSNDKGKKYTMAMIMSHEMSIKSFEIDCQKSLDWAMSNRNKIKVLTCKLIWLT